MNEQHIKIGHFGARAFLFIGDKSIELSGYKISSSTQGGAELEVRISISDVMAEEIEITAKKESLMPQHLQAMNDAP